MCPKCALLERKSYHDVQRDDTSPWNFVLGNDSGHELDVHAVVFDDKRNGLYGPIEKRIMYPAGSLTGTGTIDGLSVRCISPEHMVKFPTGYKLRESDYKDVAALCERFGIEMPEEYTKLNEIVILKKPVDVNRHEKTQYPVVR